jgi:hypothetical protein
MPTYIKDLFDLPDAVRGGGFVLRLSFCLCGTRGHVNGSEHAIFQIVPASNRS